MAKERKADKDINFAILVILLALVLAMIAYSFFYYSYKQYSSARNICSHNRLNSMLPTLPM